MKSHINKKPKFCPGDWITNGLCTWYIKFIEDGMYYQTDGCIECAADIESIDKKYHIWTINDAQKGDILVNDFHMIFIFKEIINNTCISSYSVIERENDVILNSIVETEIGDINLVNFLPATKEQRTILFKRMKEAGYEWNSQKKEFQNINFNEKFKNMLQKTYENMLNTSHKEPKFNVGDWVVSPNGIYWHIDSIQNDRYEVTADTGQCGNWPLDTNIYHLWTIQNAKDGDVLAIDPWSDYPSSFVAIYKKQNGEDFDSYCFVGFDGKFYKGENGHSTEEIHPATKEQRDLLFQKMKETGYEWDAENLQLTKILHVKELSDGINIDKQKTAEWSEEDKYMIEDICYAFEKGSSQYKWLKSLKSRILPQPKQEWSEEDERMLHTIIADFKGFIRYNTSTLESYFNVCIDWLKSLKERYTWKPSNEQIKAFEHFVRSIGESGYASPYENNTKLLYSLLNDLKKLTE